jgi:ankyrin repeat protein
MWAVEKGHSDAVKFLLLHGSDPNLPLPSVSVLQRDISAMRYE